MTRVHVQGTQTIIHQHGLMIADTFSEISPTTATATFLRSELAMSGMSSSLVEGFKAQWIDGVRCPLSQFAHPIEDYR